MRPLVINVDSDGVMADIHTPWIEALNQETGLELGMEDITQWDMAAIWGISKSQFYRVFDQLILEGFFADAPPVPGAIGGINALLAAGHRVRIVTNKILKGLGKTRQAELDVIEWYATAGLLDRVEMIFTGAKYGKDGYPADLVVDDQPDLGWIQHYPTVNLLFDQPWNRSVTSMGVFRASGWVDVLEVVEQMGGGILRQKEA